MKTLARKEIIAFLEATPGSTEAAIVAAMTAETVGCASAILKKMVKGERIAKTDDSYTLTANIGVPRHVTP
jgi:predicted regulator of Ras-like GTPase activity (Roadblock/LC7/MglB family)